MNQDTAAPSRENQPLCFPKNPRVTVLLTVFNGLPYLPDAVASILNQTLPDFFFIIVNNGSFDETGVFLDQVHDKRLRVISLPSNVGRTPALNRGFALVATEYTAIIDADDLAEPGRLAAQVAFLDAHPHIALVGSDITLIDPHGDTIGQETFPAQHEDLLEKLAVHNQFAHAACCFRTAEVKALAGYPEEYVYAQDFGLWLALLKKGAQVASIPQTLARIRVHPAQATRNPSQRALRQEEHVRLARELQQAPGLSRAASQLADIRAAFILLQLKRIKEAFLSLGAALRKGPFLLLANPLLWERAKISLNRFVKHV